jgi:hypothetical protein
MEISNSLQIYWSILIYFSIFNPKPGEVAIFFLAGLGTFLILTSIFYKGDKNPYIDND